jgi:hypothetical protein
VDGPQHLVRHQADSVTRGSVYWDWNIGVLE